VSITSAAKLHHCLHVSILQIPGHCICINVMIEDLETDMQAMILTQVHLDVVRRIPLYTPDNSPLITIHTNSSHMFTVSI